METMRAWQPSNGIAIGKRLEAQGARGYLQLSVWSVASPALATAAAVATAPSGASASAVVTTSVAASMFPQADRQCAKGRQDGPLVLTAFGRRSCGCIRTWAAAPPMP